MFASGSAKRLAAGTATYDAEAAKKAINTVPSSIVQSLKPPVNPLLHRPVASSFQTEFLSFRASTNNVKGLQRLLAGVVLAGTEVFDTSDDNGGLLQRATHRCKHHKPLPTGAKNDNIRP